MFRRLSCKMAKVLKSRSLDKLKCSLCGCYLSVGPVTIGSNGNICGRCPAKSNHVVNKTAETLAMAHEFPCRYESNGCTVRLAFGSRMIEHETVCEFKFGQNVCPITDTCKWKGKTEDVFQHCVDEHSENVLNSLNFTVNLETSTNKNCITEIDKNRLYLLHLVYNKDVDDGLSVTVSNLAFGKCKQLDYYDLMLESPDEKNWCHFSRFDKDRYITKAALSFIDKTDVIVGLGVPYNEEREFEPVCDLCGGELPLYMLVCNFSGHYVCRTCSTPDEMCTLCSTISFLDIKTNYYVLLMQYKDGVFACCNAINGCRFSGSVDKLEDHEQTCKTYKCFMVNCKWSGDIIEHIEKMHKCITDKDLIEIKSDTFIKGSMFSCIVATCKFCSFRNCNRYSPKVLVIISIRNLCNSNFVQIAANYVSSHPNFSFGNISVTLGQNFITLANKISSLLETDMSINYENSVCVSQELFVKHKYLRINVNDLAFVCDEHKP